MAAGAINAIVGSGSLITFPTLLLLGYPPLVANVSNTVGLVFGSISGAVGYRRELVGQRERAIPLSVAAGLGGLTGAALLLVLPAAAFATIVPVLILVACALVAVQPRLSAWVAARRLRLGHETRQGGGPILMVGVYLTGIYGGYFGAAQGVILIALLAILIDDELQRLNGLKNVIASVINAVAAIIFIIVAPVAWGPAILLADRLDDRRSARRDPRSAVVADRTSGRDHHDRDDRRGQAPARLTAARDRPSWPGSGRTRRPAATSGSSRSGHPQEGWRRPPAVAASEPVTRIMSVPAAAARTARVLAVRPRAAAVPLSESVMVTPLNPRSWRRSVSEITRDQPAAWLAS